MASTFYQATAVLTSAVLLRNLARALRRSEDFTRRALLMKEQRSAPAPAGLLALRRRSVGEAQSSRVARVAEEMDERCPPRGERRWRPVPSRPDLRHTPTN